MAWFVARDVALALAYTNPARSIQDHCKNAKSLKDIAYTKSVEANEINDLPLNTLVINESDVLRLIVKSSKPEAEAFERWVFEDVLPSIRNIGSYSLPNIASTVLFNTDALKLAREAARTAKAFGFTGNMVALSADCFVHKLTGISVLAAMNATHLVADERGRVYTPTELGKLMTPPLSAVKFNLQLEASGLQKKELGGWLPTDEAQGFFEWADTGKQHSNGTPVKQLRWFKSVLDRLPHNPQHAIA